MRGGIRVANFRRRLAITSTKTPRNCGTNERDAARFRHDSCAFGFPFDRRVEGDIEGWIGAAVGKYTDFIVTEWEKLVDCFAEKVPQYGHSKRKGFLHPGHRPSDRKLAPETNKCVMQQHHIQPHGRCRVHAATFNASQSVDRPHRSCGHVRAMPTQNDPEAIPAAIIVVDRMQRLMQVADEMDQESESFGANRTGEPPVSHHPCIAVDLSYDAIIALAIVAGIVTIALNRNIDEVPRRGVRPLRPDFICPSGGLHYGGRGIPAQQPLDLCPRRRGEFIGCYWRRCGGLRRPRRDGVTAL
jgi:hypothetical protein